MLRRNVFVLVLIGAALAAAALAHGQSAAVYRIDTFATGLNAPSDLAPLTSGGVLVADTGNNRVVQVVGGTVTTLASELNAPRGVSPVAGGGYLVADTANNVIRRYAADGSSTTVAGGPVSSRSPLSGPQGVAALSDGAFLVADTGNNRVVRIASDGTLTTVAGSGTAGFSGDGGPATRAQLNAPAKVVALAGGGLLVADTGNSRIRRVDTAGTITTVAGPTGLTAPEGVAVRSDGSLVIADTGGQRIQELGTDGTLRTIAGTGTAGFSGDGGDATAAQLNTPRAVALGTAGVLVADTANNRIRALTPTTPPTPPQPVDAPLPEPTPTPPPGVAPPQAGKTAVIAPVRGVVRVRLAGRRGFITLREATNIGVGTELDTTRGAVALFFQTASGTGAGAVASQGRFTVLQPARPLVDGERPGLLVLSQPLAGCTRASRLTASAAAAKARQRKVKVRAKGKIRTKGKYGSAIVLGTQWTITDRCPVGRPGSTTERTIDGLVQVRDFVKHRTVRVPAGRSYTARARR